MVEHVLATQARKELWVQFLATAGSSFFSIFYLITSDMSSREDKTFYRSRFLMHLEIKIEQLHVTVARN